MNELTIDCPKWLYLPGPSATDCDGTYRVALDGTWISSTCGHSPGRDGFVWWHEQAAYELRLSAAQNAVTA